MITEWMELFKAKKEKEKGKKKDTTIFSPGYYTFGGVIAGIGMVFLWEKLGIPYQDHQIKHALLTGKKLDNCKNITVEKSVALAIAIGLMMSELFGVKGGFSSGAGFLLGNSVASDIRKGKYIGNI
jgi:hypothetical protein